MSTVEETLQNVKRFRIVTVGGAGAGKSSLINCVFKVTQTQVSDYKTGIADIYQEITSEENPRFVCHDSKGFEPASAETFKVVEDFIREKTVNGLELSERLHAVWLCIRIPTAGGRVMEAGQEKILQLVNERKIPVVVVFTHYDRLLRMKGGEKSREVLNDCIALLGKACHDLQILEVPPYINVSTREKYDENIINLVRLTQQVVEGRRTDGEWLMWAMAQRRDIPLKIKASITTSMNYYARVLFHGMVPNIPGLGRPMLQSCLFKVHEDIVNCWNFEGEGDQDILNSDEFRQMMLFIVQDININQQSGGVPLPGPDVGRLNEFLVLVSAASAHIAPPAAILGLSYAFLKWVIGAVVENVPDVQRLLMAYTIDLTLLLQILFKLTFTPEYMGHPSWDTLSSALNIYQGLQPDGPIRVVHEKILSVVARWGGTMSRDIMSNNIAMIIKEYTGHE